MHEQILFLAAIACYSAAFIFAASCAIVTLRILRNAAEHTAINLDAAAHLHIVLPVYRESGILESSVAHFTQTGLGAQRITLLLSHGDQETIDAAVRSQSNAVNRVSSPIEIIVCPEYCDSKARKLQYFWDSYLDSGQPSKEWHDRLFCVFDIDARPTLGFFHHIRACVGQHTQGALIFQAVPVASPVNGGALADALAVAHAERAAMEFWALQKWSGRPDRPMLLGLMGAAMVLNGAAVRMMSPWPPYSDDVQVGYRSDLLAIPRVLVPLAIPVQGTTSFKDWWLQQLRIANGVQTRLKECMHVNSPEGSRPALVRAFLSVLFDWSPGIRLASAAAICFTAGSRYPVAIVTVLTLQAGLQLLFYVCAANSRRAKVSARVIALSMLGAVVWSPLRTCSGIAAFLSRQLPSGGSLASALTGSSTKKTVD